MKPEIHKGIIAWFAHNSVAANLLMVGIVATGLLVAQNIKQEIYPTYETDTVEVDIEAGNLENVLKIPRAALREGNRIWLVKPDNRIRIADPEILWRQEETIFISNILQDGERLIVSDLRSALPEMEVRPRLLETSETPDTQ